MKDVWDMLEECAPGYSREPKPHNWCVRYGDKVYPSLTKNHPSVPAGEVRKLARELGIVKCAKRVLGDRLR
jgi:hypothetical protein